MRYSKQFILVIVLIPLITIIFLSLVWVRYPQSFMDSVIEFGAAVLGISFAFYLDRFIESRNKDKDRQNLLDSLRRELETIEKTAINKGIYPYIWDSGLSKEKLSLTQTG